MLSHGAHKFWLKVSGAAIFAFGILGFFGTMPATSEPLRWGMDLLSFPVDGWPIWGSPETWFLSALAGGFLAGWGATIFCSSLWLYDLAPEPTRRMIVTGILAWFVIDSSGSVTSGNWENAIWNIVVLLFLVGPMWRPAQSETNYGSDTAPRK